MICNEQDFPYFLQDTDWELILIYAAHNTQLMMNENAGAMAIPTVTCLSVFSPQRAPYTLITWFGVM